MWRALNAISRCILLVRVPKLMLTVWLVLALAVIPLHANADDGSDENAAKAALTPDRGESVPSDCVVVIKSRDEQEDDELPGGFAESRAADESERGVIERFWLDGEVEYRYEELRRLAGDDDGGVTDRGYERDVALLLGANLEFAGDWRLRAALRSGREGRPLTNWVGVDDLGDKRWLGLEEYWLRKDLETGRGQSLRLQGGRFTFPFELTQLTIDNDLYMSGGYAQYRWEPNGGELARIRLSLLGAQLLSGCEGSGPARVLSARLDSRWEVAKSVSWDAALSYHGLSNADTIQAAVAATGASAAPRVAA